MRLPPQNPLLTRANHILRRQRPLLPETFRHGLWTDPAGAHRYSYLYFRTRGCRFSQAGQCAMCDYWVAAVPTEEVMLAAVEEALAGLPERIEVLQVNGLGNLFDPWEVPPRVRRAILTQVAARDVGTFVVETRPETITRETLDELVAHLPGKCLGIELGLESVSPWVQRFCLNKTSAQALEPAITLAHQAGIKTYVNVLLGAPFLSPAEAEADAVHTIRRMLDLGVDACVLFPAHIKRHTLLAWLWRRGEYACPSLWSLARVLTQLEGDQARTIISWYRPQYTALEIALGRRSEAVPDTCPRCRDRVLKLLDAYRDDEDPTILGKLDGIACACRADHSDQPDIALAERVRRAYERIGGELLPPGLWPKLRRGALAGVEATPEHLRTVEGR